ncbi:hypothetical protein [Flavimaricola marinus]|uniref:Phage late control gene D protein (GPD) n=1 Tax=Flavimaricola marinus TaxID=1819565 RepID=A0A238L9L8_9RHOB|nr:hypothetical protein [Flavimaricola marinus]SMY06263.1 hypothetical protein LOM8899_00386 [Flavimaricola marinus]
MLNAFGVRLTLLIGQGVPVPPPAFVSEALESAEVAISDSEPSGFSVIFRLGRSDKQVGAMPLMTHPAMQSGSRIVLTGILGLKPTVLIDGIVESVQMGAGDGGQGGTLTLMGRDLTALMDREERQEEYPGMAPGDIANVVIARYAQHGIVPDVRPPLAADRDAPTDRVPLQNGTDLAYLTELAAQFDHVFTIIPGPAPLTSRAYWGPPPRIGAVQRAISVDMGSASNATGLSFENEASEAGSVAGEVRDGTTGAAVPVRSVAPVRPPLAARPSVLDPTTASSRILRPQPGQSVSQAMGQAQAQSDASSDTLKVTGELDLGRYGAVLEPRKLVGLRGAGFDHDGFYYVRDVVHSISRGAWSQAFTLVREGLGTTTPIVRP